MAEKKPGLEKLLLLILFLFFYGIVLCLGIFAFHAFNWPPWIWPMHWLVPLAGFFLSYLAFDWIQEYLEIKLSSWWVPVIIIVFALLAFYVSAWFYYCNGFTDIQAAKSTCDSAGSQRAIEYINQNFFGLFQADAFFYFWLAVLFGWISRVALLRAVIPPAPAKSKKKK